jgi:hypothetical protein
LSGTASFCHRPRKARDAFVDQIFAGVGLPLLRIAVQQGYTPNDLAAQLAPYLYPAATQPAAIPPPMNQSTAVPPLCPKCGVPMALRTVSKGARAGQRFYGCANYPRCREMVPMPSL